MVQGKFYKYQTSMDQNIIFIHIRKSHIDLDCSSICLVNSFTDVFFIIVAYGENAVWATWEYFTASDHWAILESRLRGVMVSKSK